MRFSLLLILSFNVWQLIFVIMYVDYNLYFWDHLKYHQFNRVFFLLFLVFGFILELQGCDPHYCEGNNISIFEVYQNHQWLEMFWFHFVVLFIDFGLLFINLFLFFHFFQFITFIKVSYIKICFFLFLNCPCHFENVISLFQ